jgi:hypothetical protein
MWELGIVIVQDSALGIKFGLVTGRGIRVVAERRRC